MIIHNANNILFSGLLWTDDEAGCIVSYCPELNIHSAGKTEEEAKAALREAIMLWVEHYQKQGTLTKKLFGEKKRSFSIDVSLEEGIFCAT